MSEFPVEASDNGDMHTVMENFQKKNNLIAGRSHHISHHPQVTTTSSQVVSTIYMLLFTLSQIFAYIF